MQKSKGMSIRAKMLVSLLALSLIPVIILGGVNFYLSWKALRANMYESLEGVRDNKKIAIDNYFTQLKGDLISLTQITDTLEQEAFDRLESILTSKKQHIEDFFGARLNDVDVLAKNPLTAEAVKAFEAVGSVDGPVWKSVEEKYGGWLTAYANAEGRLDLLLVSKNGHVLFTAKRESDLGENLKTGPLASSPAGQAFARGLEAVTLQDYDLYEPLGDAPAAFAAAPIKGPAGVAGVVMLRIAADRVDAIMHESVGLGVTGEAYLVGPDKLFRSNSRFIEDKSAIVNKEYVLDSGNVEEALAGKTGRAIIRDYKGEPALSAYAPLAIPGVRWIITATVDLEEAFTPRAEGREKDFYARYKEQHKYSDIFLLLPDGYIFYSVAHRTDFQTNVTTGELNETNFGELIAAVIDKKEGGMSDFEKYGPAGGAPLAFFAHPLLRGEEISVVVATAVSLEGVNRVMGEQTGLGATGEAYLVGADKLWRNESRFVAELGVKSAVLDPRAVLDTDYVRGALAGDTGTGVETNYRGVSVLSSWAPIFIQRSTIINPVGIRWALVSEITWQEVGKPLATSGWATVGLLAAAALLVFFIAAWLSNGLTRQVNRIMELFSEIGMGNFEARAEVTSRDELGEMASLLNSMLDNVLDLIQSSEERDAIEDSITKLLDEIADFADGDLTKRAEVTTEITGTIADSFNDMAEQLTQVVQNVKEATIQVSSTSQEVSTSTENLAASSVMQATQISDAIAAINEMAASIQQVSENASASAAVSEKSTTNAREGAAAVRDTNRAMDAIRENARETARAIKRLGESSQEIGNIVQIIDDIADRTSILALNASIQAAMAGDAGRGFAVVAEEVQRLAERSTSSTKQIDTLVKNIQGEINEAGTSMEESIQRVVEGGRLSGVAQDKLLQIETVSTQLAELVQSISTAAKQQARASENIAKTMEEVGEVSTQTSASTSQTAVSMRNMAETSDQLRVSVEAFKLAGEEEESK